MSRKTSHIQVRVTPAQKAAIRRLAREAGLDLSGYILLRALPPTRLRFEELLRSLGTAASAERPYVFAEINDFLAGLSSPELENAVARIDPEALDELSHYDRNYVAAMVELACGEKDLDPPAWTSDVRPLDRPRFGTALTSLRPYLLRVSPVPFKRRNIFIDASIGDRV
ncbi:MAG: plasmid mobilization protein [Gemmatimonadota bacterium]